MTVRVLASLLALALLAGCGPSERPKFNIKKARDYDPVAQGNPEPPAPAATTATPPPDTAVEVVEIGAFKGNCDQSFSGINDADVVALANPSGLRSYRLAGIAIPDEIRVEAHSELRSWLTGEPVGIEIEMGAPGPDAAAYLYRCSSKTMVNAELVRAGLAVVVDTPSVHRDALNKASMEALSVRRGVWGKGAK